MYIQMIMVMNTLVVPNVIWILRDSDRESITCFDDSLTYCCLELLVNKTLEYKYHDALIAFSIIVFLLFTFCFKLT